MKKIKLSILASTILVSSLSANDNMAKATVYSATKSEQSIKDVTSNVNVITAEDIKERRYLSVVQALNSLSGVSFTSNGGMGATSSVNLRGTGNNRTLVLVDGIRYQDPSNISGANISHLMITDIEKIEVIKGAQSGIWGADATAGVINIITKEAKDGLHSNINVEFGSFNTQKYGALVSNKTKQYDMKFSINKITSDSFSVQAPRGEELDKFEDDPYTNTTLNFKANYFINDSSSVKVNITDIDALKEYDSYDKPNDKTMKSDVDNTLYNISYLKKYNNHNIKLKVENSKFTRDEIGTVQSRWGTHYVKIFNGENKNIELNDKISYNKEDFVLIGFGSSSDDVNYIKTNHVKTQKDNKDNYTYITNSNIFDKTIFTQSIRYDDYNNFDSKVTGKLGIKYNIDKEFYVGSNVGTAYNVPNIVQELNPWGAVNENLNPEDTQSSDITIGYKDIKITYFNNKVTDLIDWYDADGYMGPIPAIYKNLDGKTTFKGFEAEYEKDITDDILLSLNYTNIKSKDKDDKDLARRPKETVKLSVDYYGFDKTHINFNSEYIGERYDDKAKLKQTGKYTVSNFVVNYDIDKSYEIYCKIDNLTNKYYQTIDGYATSPRAYYAGLKAKF
jgi:vitamin B12 transporter